MAEEQFSSSSSYSDASSENSSECDSESFSKKLIDGSSSKFIPELALNCEETLVPSVEEAPTFLNIIAFEKAIPNATFEKAPSNTALKKISINDLKGTAPSQMASSSSKPTAATSAQGQDFTKYPIPGRKFLPHQLPVYRPPKKLPNFNSLMDEFEGPMSCLKVAIDNKKRIKVWIRQDFCNEGYFFGFLVAFDRHWNLIMKDVDEVIQRKKSTKTPAEGPDFVENRKPEEINVKTKSLDEKEKRKSLKDSRLENKKEKINNNTFLIEGPDALLTLRLGLERMRIEDQDQETSAAAATSSSSLQLQPSKKGESIPKNYKYSTKKDSKEESDTECSKVITKSQIKKRGLRIFKETYVDKRGYRIVGNTSQYEIAKRHLGQVFVAGDIIVFIETSPIL